MTDSYDLSDERAGSAPSETSEYRRTHYRVYDADGYATSFAATPPENATMQSVAASICARFQGTKGTGFESKDLVVMFGSRIVAVIRRQGDGQPLVTTFAD